MEKGEHRIWSVLPWTTAYFAAHQRQWITQITQFKQSILSWQSLISRHFLTLEDHTNCRLKEFNTLCLIVKFLKIWGKQCCCCRWDYNERPKTWLMKEKSPLSNIWVNSETGLSAVQLQWVSEYSFSPPVCEAIFCKWKFLKADKEGTIHLGRWELVRYLLNPTRILDLQK